MVRPRSTATLMQGMAAAMVILTALVVWVGIWGFMQLQDSVGKVRAVDEAAVTVAQARSAVAFAATPQTVASVPDAAWTGLALDVAAAGVPALYEQNAAAIVTQLREVVSGDLTHRTAASAALVDLQNVIERRRSVVLDLESRRATSVATVLALTMGLGLAAVGLAGWWVRGSLLVRFRAMSTTARRIVDGADERMDTSIRDPLGAVAAAFNAGLDKQADLMTKLGTENRRASIGRQIADGLDLALDSPAAYEVVRRAMLAVAPHATSELIVADAEDIGEVSSVAATHEPLCPVADTQECAAMRRGATQRFADSTSINACPHLSGREIGSATCVPATFLGQPLGVLHVVTAPGAVERPDEILLTELATLAANRIGTMRAFAQEEHHARTDSLTGLLNRRAFERSAHRVEVGVLAMSDLDHFKLINDIHGHQTGDQALTLFADVLTRATRADRDLVARWGGEEFAVLLPGADMAMATDIIGRVQELLARECVTHAPAFTSSWGLAQMSGSIAGAIAHADAALYQAKADGRNRFVVAPLG